MVALGIFESSSGRNTILPEPECLRLLGTRALGRATVLGGGYEAAPLPTLDDERPAGQGRHYVRLHCEIVSGRRLASSRV